MVDIEIPQPEERGRRYRLFEALPGLLTWLLLFMPLILSFINVTAAAIFILGYLLIYFARALGVAARAVQGYNTLRKHQRYDWQTMLQELVSGEVSSSLAKRPKWHYENILRLKVQPPIIKPEELIHVAMIATYNESREVLEPTIQAVLDSDFDMDRVILVIAYEERGGPNTEAIVKSLIEDYGDRFMHAMAVMHPKDIPGEIIGKGGNITRAGRELEKYLSSQEIDPLQVVVTTLDADNRPHKQYFAALSYVYVMSRDPLHTSFQPIPVYTNNIWDAPAPMRVVATGNTYYNIVLALRPHMLRNFSAHAQCMKTLIDTDYWSVRTIVEDGHQFWRTYFRYDGDHQVFPIYVPIYQDAVLASSYLKTLKAQFIQMRRWTWGASDVAYVADKGFFSKNHVPRGDLILKFLRLLEGHVTWAVAPLLLLFSAFIPSFIDPQNIAANELPLIVSRVQTAGLLGISVTLFVCLRTLPPKPARYRHHRTLWMILQWVYLPVTTIAYNSLAALYSQTRLIFGKYIGKFDVTEKTVITDSGKK